MSTYVPKRPLAATPKLSLRKRLEPLFCWLEDASSFYPWEEVSSFELAVTSLFILKRDNIIRKPLIRLVRWKLFDQIMLLVIVANCVTLAMASNKPGFDQSTWGMALARSNYVFIGIFMAEAAIKITALGFVFEEYTYLRNGWNILDFIVVVMGILELTSFGNYTFVRCFRVLRPLRAITKIESLKIIVEAFIHSVPMLMDVLILVGFFFAVFGIACVELFKGQYSNRCGSPVFNYSFLEFSSGAETIQNISYVVSSNNANQLCRGPTPSGEVWVNESGYITASSFEPLGGNQWGYACPWMPSDNPNDLNYPHGLMCVPYGNPDIGGYRNFDNILIGWVQIFQHMSAQDWSYIMYSSQATLSWWTWMLHVSMLIIGAHLIANLILAVIVLHFTKNYSEAKVEASMNSLASRMSSKLQRKMSMNSSGSPLEFEDGDEMEPAEDPSTWGFMRRVWERLRDACYITERSKGFQYTTIVMIVSNALILAIVWYDMPASVASVTLNINFFFTMFFVLEMFVKLMAMGPRKYASDNFNLFDALVTMLGVVDMTLTLAPNVSSQGSLSVFRAFRLLRVLRLARSWKSLNRIIKVLIHSLASVGWLTVLLFLYLFITGLLGMTFFSYKLDSCPLVPGSVQLCPPGMTWRDCPSHFDCYITCDERVALQWYQVPGSPYGNQAYCEVFPRELSMNYTDPAVNGTVQYLAQVGKAVTFMPNFDNIYQAMISTFIMLTGDNWDANMKTVMVLYGSPWLPAFYTLIVMIIGQYTVLNLFLAILLSNLNELVPEPSGGAILPATSADLRAASDGGILDRVTTKETSLWLPPEMQQKMIANELHQKSLVDLNVTGKMNHDSASTYEHSLGPLPWQEQGSKQYWEQQKQDSFHPVLRGEAEGGWSLRKTSAIVPQPKALLLPIPPLEEGGDSSPLTGIVKGSKVPIQGMLLGNKVTPFSAPGAGSLTKKSQPSGMSRALSRSSINALKQASTHLGDSPNSSGPYDTLEGRSLFFLSSTNKIRIFLAKVVWNPNFEFTMLFLILLSSLELCFDDASVVPGTSKATVFYAMDIFFTVAFGIEALMKILVQGLLFNGSHSYLRQAWNILDLFIVLIGILVLALQSVTNPSYIIWLRAFRAFRALRPLRIATKFDGIRVVVAAMVKSIPAVSEVFLVAALFYYIFAVLGVNLMCGLFLGCYSSGNLLDPYYLVPPDQNINRTWCEAGMQNISTSYYHNYLNIKVPEWSVQTDWGANGVLSRFDNAIMSLWVVFWMTSMENWSPIMIQAMDVTTLDEQPLYNNNIFMALYFIVYIVLGVFLTLNMVIGVAINTFNRLKEEQGSMFLTESQQEWLTIQRMMASVQLKKTFPKPKNRFRMSMYRFVITEAFDRFIMAIIFMNIFTMFLSRTDESDAWVFALNIVNAVFTGIFVIEMVLKWIAIGFKEYFTDGWCQFDFLVVVVCSVGVIVDFASTANISIIPLLRVLRVLRIFKLIPKARGLKLMITALLWSVPALLNVASVLLLFMYIFAIIGMNIFQNLKWQQNIDYDANFDSFPTAMLLLFRIQSGENWNYLMVDSMVLQSCIQISENINIKYPGSNTSTLIYSGTYFDSVSDAHTLSLIPSSAQVNRCSPSPVVAALYFCVYMAVCTYLVLQLVIAVIIDNIENQNKIESMAVTQKHIQAFVDSWEELDVEGSGFIDANNMTTLLQAVPTPMGVKGRDRHSKCIQDIVMSIQVPLRNQRIHFLETLHALAGRVAGADVPADQEFTIHDRLIQKLPKDEIPPKYSVGDYYAALHVKTNIKGFLVRNTLEPVFKQYEEDLQKQYEEDLQEGFKVEEEEKKFPLMRKDDVESSNTAATDQQKQQPGIQKVPPTLRRMTTLTLAEKQALGITVHKHDIEAAEAMIQAEEEQETADHDGVPVKEKYDWDQDYGQWNAIPIPEGEEGSGTIDAPSQIRSVFQSAHYSLEGNAEQSGGSGPASRSSFSAKEASGGSITHQDTSPAALIPSEAGHRALTTSGSIRENSRLSRSPSVRVDSKPQRPLYPALGRVASHRISSSQLPDMPPGAGSLRGRRTSSIDQLTAIAGAAVIQPESSWQRTTPSESRFALPKPVIPPVNPILPQLPSLMVSSGGSELRATASPITSGPSVDLGSTGKGTGGSEISASSDSQEHLAFEAKSG